MESNATEASIQLSDAGESSTIEGNIAIPRNAKGVIIFAHGSGSGRNSPRNQYVAKVLNEAGFATALFDLLTEEEAREDEKTKKLRFDIELLADRLIRITEWVQEREETRNLKMGYYGASTGAAAALIAAAHFGGKIKAIVSRGGRVDLAASSLKQIHEGISILFLVGSNDPPTIKWNENVMKQLKQVANKRLVLVQGAGHLFEEEGKLEEVAKHSASWFKACL